MNTLSRAATAAWLPDEDAYHALRAAWRSCASDPARRGGLTAAHHLLYLALLGRDWRPAFPPPFGDRKAQNGALWNSGLYRALGDLKRAAYVLREVGEAGVSPALLAPFGGRVTPRMLDAAVGHLPDIRLGLLDPEYRAASREERAHFWEARFPTYCLPTAEEAA